MDFEKQRKNMLEKLSKVRREKVISRKVNTSKMKTLSKSSQSTTNYVPKVKKEVVIFGANSFFLRSFLQIVRGSYTVFHSDNLDTTCEYCINSNIDIVMLDMDEPTDSKIAVDVFTSLKTVNSEINIFLLCSNADSTAVQTLAAQGGIVITKPIEFDDLFAYFQ